MEIVTETYRPDVAEKIAALGAKITDEMLVDQSHDVHKKQADFVAAAVRLGLMLEAKFAAICKANRAGNGERTRFTANGSALPFADDENKERNEKNVPESFPEFCRRVFGAGTDSNMRRYRWLGRRYLQAATETLHPQSSDLAKSLQHADSIDAEALMLDNAGGKNGGLSLRNWIAGRSLRQLIVDLRQADSDASKEEAAEGFRALALAERDAANDELAAGEPEPDTPEAAENDKLWRQMNLPGFVKLAKQEAQIAFERIEDASGIAPRAVLKKLWTDYRNALAAKVKAADAKLSILSEIEH